MIKIQISSRVIEISDSEIPNEKDFVDWLNTLAFSDCVAIHQMKSAFYRLNTDLCDEWATILNTFGLWNYWIRGEGFMEDRFTSNVVVSYIDK